LTFRPLSEDFIRRSWYSILLDLDTITNRRVEKVCLQVPCANCDKTYIGETERKLCIILQEHRMEVDSKTKQTFTRSHRTASLSEHNKSRYSREPCDRPQDEGNGD